MNEIIPSTTPVKRRRYSKAFKAKILAACDQPDASVAGVALANGLNTNLVHKWRRLAKSNAQGNTGQPDFLPVAFEDHYKPTGADAIVSFEVASIKVHWPLEHVDQAIAWLRALNA